MSEGLPFEELMRRLRLLEDERAIQRTLYTYGHSMDYGPDEDFVGCFTDDGIWDVRMRLSGGGFVCRGREEIRASLAGQTEMRAPALFAKHVVVDPVIEISGDEAKVQSYFLRVEPAAGGGSRIVASGRYVDSLLKGPDGVWRFAERIAEIDDM